MRPASSFPLSAGLPCPRLCVGMALEQPMPTQSRGHGTPRLNQGGHFHPFYFEPGRPHIGGRRANRLFERIGFPVEGDEGDLVARHDGAIVATGFVERLTLLRGESPRLQYYGKTVRFL